MIQEVDIAIVTALAVERRAVVGRLENATTVSEPDQPYTFYRGQITLGASAAYEVVVMQLLDVGNVDAATCTATLIHRWVPRSILMVGIAGGVSQSGIGKGDVAVARYIHYYEPGKRRDAGEERRPRVFNVDQVLFGKAQAYEAFEWKDNVSVQAPDGTTGFVPKAYFGPIGAGELVIADSTTIPLLLKEVPKLIAVATEGAGVAQATQSAALRFLEIRGISDLADGTKSDSWHEYSANAAAAFTFGFLKTKPLRTVAEVWEREKAQRPVPLMVIRAQSQTQIRPDELLPALSSDLRDRDIQTALLDLTTDVAPGGSLGDPTSTVRKLVDAQGELLSLLTKRDEVEFVFHGLLHIPLAGLIGFLFSDRLRVRLFDFHPTCSPPSWIWPHEASASFPSLSVAGIPEQTTIKEGDFVVRMSVSYLISAENTRAVVSDAAAEIDLVVSNPSRGIVQSERQVFEYGKELRKVLDGLANMAQNPRQKVHLFYAGPVSLAFHVGQLISESIHPPVLLWNYRRRYEWAIDLSAAAKGEVRIVWPNGNEAAKC